VASCRYRVAANAGFHGWLLLLSVVLIATSGLCVLFVGRVEAMKMSTNAVVDLGDASEVSDVWQEVTPGAGPERDERDNAAS
jgi:hypothetical protein